MQEILNHNLENTPKNNLFSKLVFGKNALGTLSRWIAFLIF